MSILEKIQRKIKASSFKSNEALEKRLTREKKRIMDTGNTPLSTLKKDDKYLIVYGHARLCDSPLKEEDITITLKVSNVSRKGIIHPNTALRAFFDDDFTKIFLGDIHMEEELTNEGYGSALLGTLIEIAKKRNIDQINGHISPQDEGHLDRLVHFYVKHDFEVFLAEDGRKNNKLGDLVWINPR